MSFITSVLAIIFAIKLWSKSGKPIEHIKSHYGSEALGLLRKYTNNVNKVTRCELDLIFLESCKAYDVTPKFLKFKLYKKSLNSASFYKKWQDKLMLLEIKSKKNSLLKVSAHVKQSETEIRSIVSLLDWVLINKFVQSENRTFRENTEKTHEKKLLALGVSRQTAPIDPNRVIFNYSKIVIPPKIKLLLAYGLDFGLPVFKLDFIKYFFAFEKLAFKLKFCIQTEDSSDFYKQLKFLSQKYYYGFKSWKIFSIFKKDDIQSLRDFAKQDGIVVTKPDKGRSVVIVDKFHYLDGLQNIFDNSGKFEEINEEISRVSWLLEDKINNFLLKLRKMGHISQQLYNDLHASGSGPGILYGLPKVHKPLFLDNCLYRPIFAAYNVASYKISKFLVDILSPLAENKYTLKNSAQFRSEIEKNFWEQ